jgi:hypothetical protein
MTYRPRGVCRICGLPRHGSWSGDVLLLGRHRSGAQICDGSGLPSASRDLELRARGKEPKRC